MKSFRAFRLDTANQCLWRGQERVPITPKAYDVLRYFVENPGRLVTPDELLEKAVVRNLCQPGSLPKIYLGNPENHGMSATGGCHRTIHGNGSQGVEIVPMRRYIFTN